MYGEESFVDLETPMIMLGAMHGNYGETIGFNPQIGELDPSTSRSEFQDGGKTTSPRWSRAQNRTVSALITLRHVKVGGIKLGIFLDKLKLAVPETSAEEAFRKIMSPDIGFDKYERQLGVIVWENNAADIPFPRNFFCGPYDERWVAEGNNLRRVFIGSELNSLKELEESARRLRSAS